ncbi:MAG: hypothetical protein ACP5KN_12570, partial [Armatimonadota bacterium]
IVAEALLPELQVSPTHISPVPGEPLDLKLNLSSLSGQPASGSVSLAWPEGWSDGEAVPVSSDGQNTLTLRPPVDAEATNLEVVLRLTHQGRVCYVPFVARMRPRVEVKMIPDHFSVLAGKRTEEAGLHITNHTQRAVEAELTTACPAEWSVDAEREDLSLAPSETVTVPCTVTWPRFHPESLYDLLDGDVQVRVRGEEVDQRTATTVRVHMPITWVIYSPLGTELNDQISTGAHWLKILAHLVHTAHGNPYHGSGHTIDDALVAIDRAIQRQQAGNQRVVLWLRAGEQTDQLARPEVARKLSRLMELGGGVILQEDIFRLSEANRALLDSEVCPIGAPYRTRDRAGGDWRLTRPDSPAVHKFAQNVLEGDAEWRIPEGSQPAGLRFAVKPWAEVVATNAEGDPTVVVSTDPRRPVAYIAGSLEGPYMVDRQGVREYPNQMSHLLYFYAELARWLSVFGAGGV